MTSEENTLTEQAKFKISDSPLNINSPFKFDFLEILNFEMGCKRAVKENDLMSSFQSKPHKSKIRKFNQDRTSEQFSNYLMEQANRIQASQEQNNQNQQIDDLKAKDEWLIQFDNLKEKEIIEPQNVQQSEEAEIHKKECNDYIIQKSGLKKSIITMAKKQDKTQISSQKQKSAISKRKFEGNIPNSKKSVRRESKGIQQIHQIELALQNRNFENNQALDQVNQQKQINFEAGKAEPSKRMTKLIKPVRANHTINNKGEKNILKKQQNQHC